MLSGFAIGDAKCTYEREFCNLYVLYCICIYPLNYLLILLLGIYSKDIVAKKVERYVCNVTYYNTSQQNTGNNPNFFNKRPKAVLQPYKRILCSEKEGMSYRSIDCWGVVSSMYRYAKKKEETYIIYSHLFYEKESMNVFIHICMYIHI
jgi:hypothetical protein